MRNFGLSLITALTRAAEMVRDGDGPLYVSGDNKGGFSIVAEEPETNTYIELDTEGDEDGNDIPGTCITEIRGWQRHDSLYGPGPAEDRDAL